MHRPRAALGAASPEDEIGGSERSDDAWKIGRVERPVGVHEADDVVGGGEQTGVTRRAEAA
jgi:hypothetical protein